MVLTDSHAHLNSKCYDGILNDILKRAEEKGVLFIADVGTEKEEIEKSLVISKQYKNVYSVLGYHPHISESLSAADYDSLKKNLLNPKVIGVGETGLDNYKDYASIKKQKENFINHLDVALDENKPVVLHIREAYKEAFDILNGYKDNLKFVFHCFGGKKEDAAKIINDYDALISIPGAITFKNAESLRDTVKDIPLDKLLVETDCPYITPSPYRGKQNEPAYVYYTAEKIAELKNISLEEFAAASTNNFLNFFNLNLQAEKHKKGGNIP